MSKGRYTELQVLKSGAGFYVGRMYWNPEMGGFWEPGSRESDYYASKELAHAALDTGLFTRDAPEVDLMYEQHPELDPNRAEAEEIARRRVQESTDGKWSHMYDRIEDLHDLDRVYRGDA